MVDMAISKEQQCPAHRLATIYLHHCQHAEAQVAVDLLSEAYPCPPNSQVFVTVTHRIVAIL